MSQGNNEDKPTLAQIQAARTIYQRLKQRKATDATAEAAAREHVRIHGATEAQATQAAQIARSTTGISDERPPLSQEIAALAALGGAPITGDPPDLDTIERALFERIKYASPDTQDRIVGFFAQRWRPEAPATGPDDDSLSADIARAIEQLQRLQSTGCPIPPDDLNDTIAVLIFAHTKTTDQE